MKNKIYKILLTPLYLFSLLPLKILYVFSDIFFFIVYHIIKYRKNIVIKNLKNSFPEKGENEINAIAKSFYKNFCDLFFESIKALTISKKEITKRYEFSNYDILDNLYYKNKSGFVVTGHLGNWEWFNSICIFLKHKPLAVYLPLNNKFFDFLFKTIRERFGATAVPIHSLYKTLLEYKRQNILSFSYILADQRPHKDIIKYWITFLNQDTPVFTGFEKLARKFNFSVVFSKTTKIKRGYYITEFELLTENASELKDFELTNMFFNKLEEAIKQHPDCYLWTHNRWKYKKEDFVNKL